jgi:transposase
MQAKEIVGIDVSKETFDVVIESTSEHKVFTNNKAGFKLFNKWLLKIMGKDIVHLLVVMEHTGLYSFQLEKYLHENHLPFSKVAGIQIKRSAGLVRGKSDAADARMIARYGAEKIKTLKVQAPVQKVVVRLKNLISLRDKMVRDKAGYITRLNEQKECLELSERDVLVNVQKAIIKSIQTGIDKSGKRLIV